MRKFDELLIFIGANKRLEILKIVLANVGILLSFSLIVIFLKQWMMAFVGIMALAIVNYLFFNSYFNKKKEILKDRENELITMVGYFQFFISNSYNVYQAFKSLIPYSSPWMEEQILALVNEIDNDKSIKPFMNFANKFTNKVAGNVMLSIYQMVDEGESNIHMLQFESLFQQLSKDLNEQRIEEKDRSMGSISSLPLIGAGAITVLLTFGIISVMGDMINVL